MKNNKTNLNSITWIKKCFIRNQVLFWINQPKATKAKLIAHYLTKDKLPHTHSNVEIESQSFQR